MTPLEQEEAVCRIGNELLQSAPVDWVKLRLVYSGLVDCGTARLEAMFEDGSVQDWVPPQSALAQLQELRSGMYSEGKGTWYTACYEINRPDHYRIRYGFDEEPHFDVPPPDASYALDQWHFPRSADYVPDWLQAKLIGAYEADAVLGDRGWRVSVNSAPARDARIEPGSMTPEEMMDTVQEVASRTFDLIRGEWTGIRIDHKEVLGAAATRVEVDRADGRTEQEWLPPEVDRLLNRLRTGMHQPGKGTWFRARFTVQDTGEIGVEFDQKNPPGFDFTLDPRCFYRDLQRFPRNADHIPDWLLDQLSQAQRRMRTESGSGGTGAPRA